MNLVYPKFISNSRVYRKMEVRILDVLYGLANKTSTVKLL